jgi:hypothetical protein
VAISSQLPNRDSVFRQYMEDRDFWIRRLNQHVPAGLLGRLRQALTLITVLDVHLSAAVQAAGGGEAAAFVSLMNTNYEAFHLPPDTPVGQLVRSMLYLFIAVCLRYL